MKTKTCVHLSRTMRKFAIGIFACLAPVVVSAQDKYEPSSFLTVQQEPDASYYLPAPPDTSSIQFLADFDRYQWGRSQRDTPRGKQADFDCNWQTDSLLKGYAPALGFLITKQKMPATFKLLSMVCEDASNGVAMAKKRYMRKRPYVQFNSHPANRADEEGLRHNGSYPSGHSARGWSMALMLTELFPDHANDIMKRGYDYCESRVIEGYHYQSDVQAARLAASAVVARLHAEPAFQRQVELARKEIKKANVK